jgi:DNA replication and repair protein RecF
VQPAGILKPVRLSALSLSDFRNYASLSVQLQPRHIVLTGHNGAGKTNFLEAVSLLAPGRGLRRAAYDDMARKNGVGGFAIGAKVAIDGDETQLGTGTGTAVGELSGARIVRINGTQERSAECLNDYARITWLTPAMDGVFTGPAADRRRMLDRMVLAIEPAHGRHAVDFEKAMRSRNRLIADEVNDASWYAALEHEMGAHGAAITLARHRFVASLNEMAISGFDRAAFPSAGLTLASELDELAASGGDGDLADAYRAALARSRPADRQAGRTLIGPHRSELEVTHVAKNMPASIASTGEQKALLTGMVLAHAALIAKASGLTALLLLDEIGAHFDAARRAQLFEILDRLGGQAIMTGTESHLFDALEDRAQFFSVADSVMTSEDSRHD